MGRHLIPVGVWLERPFTLHADVVCLLLAQFSHAGPESWEVECGHLLVQRLWQKVDIILVSLGLLPILHLSKTNTRVGSTKEPWGIVWYFGIITL